MWVTSFAGDDIWRFHAQAVTAPRVVTLRDSGRTVTVPKGSRLQLHLTGRYRWLKPRVRGGAVRLSQVLFIRDPGYVAWSVTARARGKAVVTAVGYREPSGRSCDPGPCSPRLFRVTFVVH
jgi:hypothetical protein